jgi:hypothetical protein
MEIDVRLITNIEAAPTWWEMIICLVDQLKQ